MKILDDLISSLKEDSIVREVYVCVFWTAAVSKNCGLASTFHEEHPYHKTVREPGKLRGKSALELAEYVKSSNVLEASIGMAAINSLLEIDEKSCLVLNAADILLERGAGKKVALIGHFPFVPRLRQAADQLWVIERNPWEGNFPENSAENLVPQADVVGISGSAFINHTIEHLLDLCRLDAYVVILGGTTPLSPLLFDYGVNALLGVKVIDSEEVLLCVSQGATFRQLKGVKLLTIKNF